MVCGCKLTIDSSSAECLHPFFKMTTIDNLFQALSLDLSILEVLLKRHRCSHGRAIYFRRISMVLQATQRIHLLDTGGQLDDFERNAIEYSQQQKRKRKRSNNKDDDHWDIHRGLLDDEQTQLKNEYKELERLYTDSFQEILSRIDHASVPLFLEVSRGFFLPFCTIALGALARVRTLILRMGRYGLSKLQELISSEEHLRKFLTFSKDLFEATMAKYLQGEKAPGFSSHRIVGVGMVSNKERRPNLVKSLGYTFPKLSNTDTDGSTSERADLSTKDAEDMPGDDQEEISGHDTQNDNQEAKGTTSQTESLPARMDEEDVGESLVFAGSAVDMTISNATEGSAAAAQLAAMDTTGPEHLDRNMELVANFKYKDKKRGSDISAGDKKAKRRKDNEPSPAPEKKKKKKKKKSKGDFFDALFD